MGKLFEQIRSAVANDRFEAKLVTVYLVE